MEQIRAAADGYPDRAIDGLDMANAFGAVEWADVVSAALAKATGLAPALAAQWAPQNIVLHTQQPDGAWRVLLVCCMCEVARCRVRLRVVFCCCVVLRCVVLFFVACACVAGRFAALCCYDGVAQLFCLCVVCISVCCVLCGCVALRVGC